MFAQHTRGQDQTWLHFVSPSAHDLTSFMLASSMFISLVSHASFLRRLSAGPCQAGTRWISHQSGSRGCGSPRSSSGSSSGWLVPGRCSGRYALRSDASCLLAGRLCRGLGGVPSRTSQPGRHLSSARCWGVQALGIKGGVLEATRRHCHTRSSFRQGPRRCCSTPFPGWRGTVVC